MNSGGVFIQSRRGSDITRGFPDIAAAVLDQIEPGTVLDGELVVLGSQGTLEFSELQRRLGAGVARARALAAERPAGFITFDLLALEGSSQMDAPLVERRTLLECVMSGTAPPLHLAPQTDEIELARLWLQQYAAVAVGLEGVVVKGNLDPYRPGRRGWLKMRLRNTYEVLLGAVTGTLARPERLVLGQYDHTGTLIVVGGTTELNSRQTAELAGLLAPPAGDHPWPTELPAGRMGRFGGGVVEVTLVEPMAVEVSADQSYEYGKWRHLTRFVRARPDLPPTDVPNCVASEPDQLSGHEDSVDIPVKPRGFPGITGKRPDVTRRCEAASWQVRPGFRADSRVLLARIRVMIRYARPPERGPDSVVDMGARLGAAGFMSLRLNDRGLERGTTTHWVVAAPDAMHSLPACI